MRFASSMSLPMCALLCVMSLSVRAHVPDMTLEVDATDIQHGIFRIAESIPVRPGELILWYPKWIPGEHAPTGPIGSVMGLVFTANETTLPWTRDLLDPYAFHVKVPRGISELHIEFQFATPRNPAQGRVTATPEILGVQWDKLLLYPKGVPVRDLRMAASLKLPPGWQYGTALRPDPAAAASDGPIRFRAVSLETLVDSPVFAGRYFRRVELSSGPQSPVFLDVVADDPDELVISADQLEPHRRLLTEAQALFGSQHFDHYDFLLALSSELGGIGLEHHRSSENAVGPGYFKQWQGKEAERLLLAHELVHSWNGKFRRPADLATANYSDPMQGSLLWIYEGLTEYWGFVLATRSGLWTESFARADLAAVVAEMQERRPGRAWRDLQDTNLDTFINPTGLTPAWVSWQRAADYYHEGMVIWLEVDTRIRELTGGQRSLDDFAAAFYGSADGRYGVASYRFEDVIRALARIAPFDWRNFLLSRLGNHSTSAGPFDLTHSGWQLVFEDHPSDYFDSKRRPRADFGYSLGIVINRQGGLDEVVWDSPAFRAGLSTAATVIAVNGMDYSEERMAQSVLDTQARHTPVELIVKTQNRYQTVRLDYFDGARYPHLQRVADAPDRLADILRPRTAATDGGH